MEQTNLNYPQVNEVLQQRYQIQKLLAKGAFGKTYLAYDLGSKDRPYCAIKYYCIYPQYPHLLKTSERLFKQEVENLKQLGTHDRIPELIDFFVEDNGFYLVQEWIVGQTLNDYFSVLQPLERPEKENQVIHFLYNTIEVLDFVHRHNILHCDLKPNNLIRRDNDGQWVLIDFGATQPIQPILSQRVSSMSASGYLAAEHLGGMPQPSSDLYSLGIMAIEALTRCNPIQLRFDPIKGEPIFEDEGYNILLINVLKKMTRQNWQSRYLSTGDLLAVFKEMLPSTVSVAAPDAIDVDVLDFEVVAPDLPVDDPKPVSPKISLSKPRLGAIAGAGVTLSTLNAVAIAVGIQALSNTALADPGAQILTRAAYALDRGDLDQAMSLVESISSDSILYEESQSRAQQWRRDWEVAEVQFSDIEEAHSREDWNAVLSYARHVPKIRYWQQKVQPISDRAQQEANRQAQNLLSQAHREARNKEFTFALKYLNQISPHTEIGATIQPKIIEYRQKQQIRARALLQQAYDRAAIRDFRAAIYFLKQIPSHTPAGEVAQRKLKEYSEKQKIKDRATLQTSFSGQSYRDTLNPGEIVSEINL